MADEAFEKRITELYDRSFSRGVLTKSFFLTPAEQYAVESLARHCGWSNYVLFGGNENAERKMAFFYPDYLDLGSIDFGEHICAVSALTRFAEPGHRDYLGAILGLGIERDRIGDIYLDGENAWFYCVPTVSQHILASLDRIGRFSVKTNAVSLDTVPVPKRNVRQVTFTVQSTRLDAVSAGMFNVSRTTAAKLIESGSLSLNYDVCIKPDVPVNEGDIISIRGYGKGIFNGSGGHSRKGRIFVMADIYS